MNVLSFPGVCAMMGKVTKLRAAAAQEEKNGTGKRDSIKEFY